MKKIPTTQASNVTRTRVLLRNVARLCVLVIWTIAIPAVALAKSGGEHHGPTTSDLVWQAINLVLLLGVLWVVARKPIRQFFADRRSEIKGDIEQAAALLREAEARYAEWQGKVVDLESELAEIQTTARRRAEEEREQILAAARDTAERIKNDAVAAVDQELRRAQSRLQDEAADLAVDLARKLLEDEVDDRDRERLLDEFIMRVEPGSATAGNQR
jgi:F-type H+-transporting ATPase subunit b